jgi:hypothetical protein
MGRRIIFERTYNHRWPSRAITEFRASDTPLLVKREVQKAALEGGYARFATKAECSAADRELEAVPASDATPDADPEQVGRP